MQTCTTFYSTFNGLRLLLARENHKLKKKKQPCQTYFSHETHSIGNQLLN